LGEAFDHVGKVTDHLAPPILARKDSEGRPVKAGFGPWMARAFRILARFRFLRGTPFDPFGRSAERRAERQMIRDYEAMIGEILGKLDAANAPTATELARLPLQVRGFGHVKMANAERVAVERTALLEQFRSGGMPVPQAAE
jgi:indolepyruvate ferredoxin oxidoreductase